MIRSLHKSRHFWKNVRNLSDDKTILPDFVAPKKLSDAIDNAVVKDDKFSTGDQVAWPTKTYHTTDEGQELPSRPKKRSSEFKKVPIPVLDRDDSENTIIIFPGQGCQYVGMGQKAMDKAQ